MPSSNAASLDVPRDRISHYFNSYGNSRGSAAMLARRKLSGQYEGQCQRGVCVGGDDRGHIEVAAEGTNGATGGGGSGGRVRQCECDIEFAPWRRACYRQCPTAGPEAICSLCDEIYESFQRSHGGQLSVREKDRERKREKEPAGRARTAERALGVCSYELVVGGTCSARFYTSVMSEQERINSNEELPTDFFREKIFDT